MLEQSSSRLLVQRSFSDRLKRLAPGCSRKSQFGNLGLSRGEANAIHVSLARPIFPTALWYYFLPDLDHCDELCVTSIRLCTIAILTILTLDRYNEKTCESGGRLNIF